MTIQARPDLGLKLHRLETKRKRLGVSLALLAGRAGLCPRRLRRIRRAGACRPAELKSLTFALRGLERERPDERSAFPGCGGETLLARGTKVAFQGISAAAALHLPADMQRAGAIYLLVTGCNVPGATAARALGVSKQYVSKAVRQIEQRREDAGVHTALQALERVLFGEWNDG